MRCLCSLVNCEFLKKTNRQRYCTHPICKNYFVRGELRNQWLQDVTLDKFQEEKPFSGSTTLLKQHCPYASIFKQIITVEKL